MKELGQILHNNPVGLSAPSYVHALIADIRETISRVYWNVQQKQWAETDDDWDNQNYDPKVPGLEWRPYYNWGGSPDDADWDQAAADKPNFSFEGVEIRWYKRFGRSMNVNVAWTPEQWIRWFDRCQQTLRAFESNHVRALYLSGKLSYPDPAGAVPLAPPSDAALYHLKLLERISLLEAQLNVVACELMTGLDRRKGKEPPDYLASLTPDDYRWTATLELAQQVTGTLPIPEEVKWWKDDR